MKKFKEFLYEITKVTMYTHPETLGADVNSDNTGKPNPIKHIPMANLHPTEPESKMKQAGSKQGYKKLVGAIKTGANIPPITVTPHPTIPGHYNVVDGHHRLYAGKTAGVRTMKSEIVPTKNVSVNPNKWEG
jgi:hypothetical protein